jgi:hypothetical protein
MAREGVAEHGAARQVWAGRGKARIVLMSCDRVCMHGEAQLGGAWPS